MSITNRERLKNKIVAFVKKNKKDYVIITETPEYLIIGKRKKFMVSYVNNNNVFSIHEKTEEEMHVVLFIVQFDSVKNKGLHDLLATDCPLLIINNKSKIEEVFELM